MISIILPTFNRDNLITFSIECVLSQSFIEYELIIVNDCSSDNTENIIRNYCNKDQRIKYIKNTTNLGCASSREIGYKISQGSILVFLDDDDWWPPDKLMKQYNALIRDDYDMIISDYQIKQNDDLIYKNMQDFADKFKNEILKRPGPFFQSIMIKKNVLNKMPLVFDKKAVPSEDWDFFIQLSKLNLKIGYVPEPLFTWNIQHDSQSLNLENEAKALSYIVSKHYDEIKKIHGIRGLSAHYRRIARLYERMSEDKNITKFYAEAFKINPLSIKNMFYFMMITVGYSRTKSIIIWIRKIRGMANA